MGLVFGTVAKYDPGQPRDKDGKWTSSRSVASPDLIGGGHTVSERRTDSKHNILGHITPEGGKFRARGPLLREHDYAFGTHDQGQEDFGLHDTVEAAHRAIDTKSLGMTGPEGQERFLPGDGVRGIGPQLGPHAIDATAKPEHAVALKLKGNVPVGFKAPPMSKKNRYVQIEAKNVIEHAGGRDALKKLGSGDAIYQHLMRVEHRLANHLQRIGYNEIGESDHTRLQDIADSLASG